MQSQEKISRIYVWIDSGYTLFVLIMDILIIRRIIVMCQWQETNE